MQVEHKTEKVTILFVKVPNDSASFELSYWNYQRQCYVNDFTLIFDSKKQTHLNKGDRPHIQLNSLGNWQLIGLTSDVTEEQAKIMVDESKGWFLKYKNYLNKEFEYFLSLDSFKSLMLHLQVYEVNPYESVKFEKMIDYWNEGIRTGKWVVLFKLHSK